MQRITVWINPFQQIYVKILQPMSFTSTQNFCQQQSLITSRKYQDHSTIWYIGLHENWTIQKHSKASYLLKLPPSLKWLHPVFHVSLLEPVLSSTIIPDHVLSQSTTDITLSPKVINPEIATILNSRKIGWWYKYLIHWKQSPDSENSWTPFTEIPTMLYFILEQFHHWNPTWPHPPQFLITSDYSTTVNALSSDIIIWPPTPPVKSWSQTTNYKPPSTTLLVQDITFILQSKATHQARKGDKCNKPIIQACQEHAFVLLYYILFPYSIFIFNFFSAS